jgi:hypothetical protein
MRWAVVVMIIAGYPGNPVVVPDQRALSVV